jgi:hypothetical protein
MSPAAVVLLVILLLLVLLLLMRVGGKVEYDDTGLSASVRAGPVYVRVYPRKKKKKAAKKKEDAPPAPQQASEAKEPPKKPSSAKQAPAAHSAEEKQPQKTDSRPKQEPAKKAPTKAAPEEASPPKQEKPQQKKAPGAEEVPKGQPSPSDRPPEERKTPLGGYLSLAMELAPEVLSLVGTAVKRLRVEELTLHYTIAGRWDAAGAAVQYGSVYATGGVLYPLLEQGLDVRRCSVGAEIDFQEENPRVYVCLNLSYQVWEALLLGIKALKIYLKVQKA